MEFSCKDELMHHTCIIIYSEKPVSSEHPTSPSVILAPLIVTTLERDHEARPLYLLWGRSGHFSMVPTKVKQYLTLPSEAPKK